MSKEVRLWRIAPDETLVEVTASQLDFESRLEVWLERDISILSADLLVIGRQVITDYGGQIDLLCLDRDGDVVVVELKRDRTPREVTAQVLDYASWVRDLSNDAVTGIAEEYLAAGRQRTNLAAAFRERFGEELPEVLNENHSLMIVASRIDASSHRIIAYLSDEYGVRLNAATFHYFPDPDGSEHMARVFLLEPDEVEHRSARRSSSKRKAPPTFDEWEEVAHQQGVEGLYRQALEGLREHLRAESLATIVSFNTTLDGGTRAICGLSPSASSSERGLHFTVYLWRLARHLELPVQEVQSALPDDIEPWKYVSTSDQDGSGFAGYFADSADVATFLKLFQTPTAGSQRPS